MGRESIAQTGYVDLLNRQYDKILGRFTSPDPVTDGQESQSLFQYSLNNPLRYTDPDGRQPADLYDQKGNKVGTDNVNDGKVYVVTDKQTVKDLKKSGGVVASVRWFRKTAHFFA